MNEDNRYTSGMNEEDTDKEKQTAGEEHQKKDVDVVIEVSEDKFEAYVTLVPLTDSPEFSTDELIDALSGERIRVGIQDAVLDLLKEEPQYNKKLLIASGIKPKEGKHGEIKYFFKISPRLSNYNHSSNIRYPVYFDFYIKFSNCWCRCIK